MTNQSKVLAALTLYPDRYALEIPGHFLTYRSLTNAIAETQGLLHSTKTAALMIENSPAWIIMDLACVAANVPLLPLPAFFSDKQIQHALKDAGVDTVFTDKPDRFSGVAEKILIGGDPYYRITLASKPVVLPSHTAKITYTSGTTDEPKGVCLTQEAMETVAEALSANQLQADMSAYCRWGFYLKMWPVFIQRCWQAPLFVCHRLSMSRKRCMPLLIIIGRRVAFWCLNYCGCCWL